MMIVVGRMIHSRMRIPNQKITKMMIAKLMFLIRMALVLTMIFEKLRRLLANTSTLKNIINLKINRRKIMEKGKVKVKKQKEQKKHKEHSIKHITI